MLVVYLCTPSNSYILTEQAQFVVSNLLMYTTAVRDKYDCKFEQRIFDVAITFIVHVHFM